MSNGASGATTNRTVRIKGAKSARTAAQHTAVHVMQRPAQAKDFQLTMAYGGDAFSRRWPAGLVMARQKFGLSRQCERAEETFALQTEAGCPLLARLRHAD